MGQTEGRFIRDCSERVIGACIEVHRSVGPGLLESAYESCLAQEFTLQGLRYERQRPLSISYKGVELDAAYRLDFVVEGHLIVEVKAVEHLLPVHSAQVITYLRLSGCPVGLLVNFHEEVLRLGLRRFVLTREPLDHGRSRS